MVNVDEIKTICIVKSIRMGKLFVLKSVIYCQFQYNVIVCYAISYNCHLELGVCVFAIKDCMDMLNRPTNSAILMPNRTSIRISLIGWCCICILNLCRNISISMQMDCRLAVNLVFLHMCVKM